MMKFFIFFFVVGFVMVFLVFVDFFVDILFGYEVFIVGFVFVGFGCFVGIVLG